MKYVITIEETNTKDFVVEANSSADAYGIAENKYRSGEFVLDPGDCRFRQLAITSLSNESTEWREF